MAALSQNGNKSADQALAGLGEAQTAGKRGPPPVHLWNPPFCGDIDMRIAADGTWFYMGTPIGRPALVRLFSTILKREDGKHFLVTPVEKVGIRVDDAPFLAVEMRKEDGESAPLLRFRTNVDDLVAVGSEHPLRFEQGPKEGLKPYVKVRGDLWALVKRPLLYDLVALGQWERVGREDWFGVRSGGLFFPMRLVREVEGL